MEGKRRRTHWLARAPWRAAVLLLAASVAWAAARPLSVLSVSPGEGATGVSTATSVSAVFSNSIKASTVTGATVFLAAPGGAAVAGTRTVSGAQVTFAPSSPLQPFTTYTMTITTGVKDTANKALGAPKVWSFTTAPVRILKFAPLPSSRATTGAPWPDFAVQIVNATTNAVDTSDDATQVALSLSGGVTGTLENAVRTVSGGVATFSGVACSATGRVTVVARASDPAITSAPTATVVLDPAVTLSSTAPAPGATDVSPLAPVVANFSGYVQGSTLSASNFRLTDPSGAAVAAAYVSGPSLTKSACLVPNAPLSPLTTYTVAVDGMLDQNGVAVPGTTWQFTTGDLSAWGLPEPVWPGNAFAPSSYAGHPAGTGVAVWAGLGGFLSRAYRPGSGWSTVKTLSTQGIYELPQVVMDAPDHATAAFSGDGQVYAAGYDFGADAWTTFGPLGASGGRPAVAAGAGVVTLAWRAASGAMMATRGGLGGFAAPAAISTTALVSRAVRLCQDPAGNAFAVWMQSANAYSEGSLVASRFDAARGQWDAPAVLGGQFPTPTSVDETPAPPVVCDAAGNATVVWGEGGIPYAARYDAVSGAWGAKAPLGGPSGPTGGRDVGLAVDAAGTVHAAWKSYAADGVSTQVLYNRYDAVANAWGAAQAVSGPSANTKYNVGVAVDPATAGGPGVVFWAEAASPGVYLGSSLFAASFANATWGQPERLSQAFLWEPYVAVAVPNAAVDSAGSARLVWDEGTGPSGVGSIQTVGRSLSTP